MKKITTLAITATAMALTLLTGGSAKAQSFYIYAGPGTDATAAANYSSNGSSLIVGGSNPGALLIDGGTIFDYASTTTTTFGTSTGSFASGLTWFGYPAAGTGGTAGTSTSNFTAGTVVLAAAFSNDGGTEGTWLGNSTVNANVTVNGGAINVTNGTVIGRDGSTGTLSVSNGTFTTGAFSSSVGLFVGGSSATGAAGTGTVTIGNGGLVDVSGAALDPLSFSGTLASAAAGNSTSDFINFTAGSTGKLELNLSTASLGSSYFTNLINNGFVEVNGNLDTTLSDFSINTTSLSGSTLALASAPATPEPSTWTLMLGGAAMLVVLQRRRSLKA